MVNLGAKPYYLDDEDNADFMVQQVPVIALCNVAAGRPIFGVSTGGEIPPTVSAACGMPIYNPLTVNFQRTANSTTRFLMGGAVHISTQNIQSELISRESIANKHLLLPYFF